MLVHVYLTTPVHIPLTKLGGNQLYPQTKARTDVWKLKIMNVLSF